MFLVYGLRFVVLLFGKVESIGASRKKTVYVNQGLSIITTCPALAD